MDKFTSQNNVDEGTSAGNTYAVNDCTNVGKNSDNHFKNDGKLIELNEKTTINPFQVQRIEFNSTTPQSKTDEIIKTINIEIGSVSESNITNDQTKQLLKNVQSNIKTDNQGPKCMSTENEGDRSAPSDDCIKKAVMSESLSSLLVYDSGSDLETNSAHSSIYQSDSDSDLQVSDQNTCSSNGNITNISYHTNTTGSEMQALPKSLGYRKKNDCNSEEESSDSDESSHDDIHEGAKCETIKKPSNRGPHTDGELGFEDLPPVPDLSTLDINVKEEDCIHMGNVSSIVDRLITIQSLPNTPAYDLDTLLFLDHGKRPLGHVYDVLGQVTLPMYVVRFNSREEIDSMGITKGLPIYSAPNTEHTQYVFVKQLMKMKGSDASWQGDNEVPSEFLDFSDDDAEYTFGKQSVNEQDVYDKKRKRNSVEKHKMFEVTMNLKNKVDTARHKMRDTYESTSKKYTPQNNQPAYYYVPPPNVNQRPPCSTSFARYPIPPNFVPPPSYSGFVNVTPVLGLNPFANQFGPVMPPFATSPQPFPPTSFGPPAIPPLPSMPQHVVPAQPPPPGFGNITVLPPPPPPPITSTITIQKPQVSMPKSVISPPKLQPNSGVVPKVQPSGHKPRNCRVPKVYMPSQPDYHHQQHYPPNLGLPKANVPPQFTTNVPQPGPINIPVTMTLPFGSPVPPWHYNLPSNQMNVTNFRPRCPHSRQYKKQ